MMRRRRGEESGARLFLNHTFRHLLSLLGATVNENKLCQIVFVENVIVEFIHLSQQEFFNEQLRVAGSCEASFSRLDTDY